MSDQEEMGEVKRKLEQIYENFGLDMEDMDTEEIERMVDYYESNKDQLDKDFKNSIKAKKILSKAEQSEEE
jgi:Asp-tRNA(Asn)/Glu-tRNA(Gln) amidotransferase C subunit